MARIRTRLNLGRNVTLGVVAEAAEDLSVIADLGLRIDRTLARASAVDAIEEVWRQRPSALLEMVGGLDDPAVGAIQALVELRHLSDSLFERGPVPPEVWIEEWYRAQRRYRSKGGGYAPPPGLPWSRLEVMHLSTATPPGLYDRLVSQEAARRLPAVPIVESVSYNNPYEVVLIVAAGLLGAGCKYGTFVELLKLVRDWSTAQEQARATINRTEAESREINARASKTELETEILRKLSTQGSSAPELAQLNLSEREIDAIRHLSSSSTEVTVDED